MKNYDYEITEAGYYILVDGIKTIHQYEPYIPNRNISYEENAKAQIEEMQVSEYANEIINNKCTIDQVSKELKEKVEALVEEIKKANLNKPATQQEVTDIELALAEVYELIAGGVE